MKEAIRRTRPPAPNARFYGTGSVSELRSCSSARTPGIDLVAPIAKVRFRAGRIDAVWGVELDDGRAVVIKVSPAPPADIDAIAAAGDAQRLPDCGQLSVSGTAVGSRRDRWARPYCRAFCSARRGLPDGRDPVNRRLLAAGLAWHVDLLRSRPDLLHRNGPGPSWCHYQAGPWPVPHDPIVDFRSTPAGYGWLDTFAQRAADQILRLRERRQK